MTLVLRMIKRSRWDRPGKPGPDWPPAGEIPAPPMLDFANTDEQRLSVWLVDDERRRLDDTLASLTAARDKIDILDYVLFPSQHLEIAGIAAHECSGETPDEAVNGHHRDLVQLWASKVFALTEGVWREHVELGRLRKPQVCRLIAGAIHRGRFKLGDLKEGSRLRRDIERFLDGGPGGPEKPR